MPQIKEKRNSITEIIESQIKDRDLITRAGKIIDNLRTRFGKCEKGFNSTELLRKIREAQVK
ncbi:MAG: hypothetical protein AB1349_10960 [Elusimicrobiota bacterium]